MSPIVQIQLGKPAMLNGRTLILRPFWALSLGGVAEALLYEQLLYRAGAYKKSADSHSVRFSYSKLQEQLPFYTRRWLVEVVKKLEAIGAILISRSSRVNEYIINPDYAEEQLQGNSNLTGQTFAPMLLFPELALSVGILEAVAIQQIHIRHHTYDGSVWVIHSMSQWQNDVFMFLGEATVKRLFARLKARGLIYVSDYKAEVGVIKKYRVNYVRVAEAIGVPLPLVNAPIKDKWSGEWMNPLYPMIKV